MKKIMFVVVMMFGLSLTAEAKEHFYYGGNFSVFYSSLSSYGEWIESDFGYVWRPVHVSRGWRPYVHGRWVWTSYGWYWVSSEPFGWATFHYGRWHYDDYYGWIWIPDDTWGPAWVEWRYNDDYVGWSPLPPQAVFTINIGISFTAGWVAPIHYWNFVPCRHFVTTRVSDYVQPMERTRRFFGSTRTEVNIYSEHGRVVNRGIDREVIERRTSARIRPVDVVERDRGDGDRIVRDGSRERIEIVRPQFDNRNREAASRPENVRRAERPIRIEGITRERTETREQDRERTYEPRERETKKESEQNKQYRQQEDRDKIRLREREAVKREQSRETWQEQRTRDRQQYEKREQPKQERPTVQQRERSSGQQREKQSEGRRSTEGRRRP